MIDMEFTIKEGLRKAEEQRKYYASMIENAERKREFNEAVKKLIQKAKKTARTGFDIPRGVSIEKLYWTIGLGKTEEQYGEYLRSLD